MLPKLLMLFVTSLLLKIHKSQQASFAKPGCQETCGNVTIPYPFGIGTGCYLYKSFEVACKGSSQDPYPLQLTANKLEFPIIEFSTDMVRVINVLALPRDANGQKIIVNKFILDKYLFFSPDRNLYIAVGCNIVANFSDSRVSRTAANFSGVSVSRTFGCESVCKEIEINSIIPVSSCTGFNGCCQHSIPQNTSQYISTILFNINESLYVGDFILENISTILLDKENIRAPVVLNWVVAYTTCDEANKTGDNLCGRNSHCVDTTNGLGYNCRCRYGYKGNPYLPNGCSQVNNECPKHCGEGETCFYSFLTGSYKCKSQHPNKSNFQVTAKIITGLSALGAFGAIGYWIYVRLNQIRQSKIKKKFFKKNGGHLLKQRISASKSCVLTIKAFSVEEMEKATENFSRRKFLGKGGQGTVYKGVFPDGTIVAIKKSNVVDEDEVERFVNEVLILSQINHRNIVKLLGCCLEYEVPLLVYEYLANDSLSQHLHNEVGPSKFSWIDRMRIAREVAGALAYLHSYASPAIFHRDIKPSNILLDQNYKAVLSDFGLSKPVSISRSHITTQVEGTFGYLDPEYFQSGNLTAKSDVYSFGVVLTELLTVKKSTSSSDSGEGLVPKFKYLVKHNQLVKILDKQVVQEALSDDVFFVAKLAKRCMKMNSKKRPSMEDVVSDLDKLRVVQLELPHKVR